MFRLSLLALMLSSSTLFAAVPQEQAARLGRDLTPLGAERAANADGSIPRWEGGLPAQPDALQSNGGLADPFAADKPLYHVDANNLASYDQLVSPGLQALLKQYPKSFRLPVYPTRRSVSYPAALYESTAQNAQQTELANEGNGLQQYREGIPFPLPQSALEVLWNHIARYRGNSVRAISNQALVERSGQAALYRVETHVNFAPSLKDLAADDNLLFLYKAKTLEPAMAAGNIYLVHETLDQVKEPRRAWVYNAGQRRVRRAPTLAYDSPGTNSSGLKTADNMDMFNGAPDRYDWSLLGKRELLIPYNSYQLYARDVPYEQLLSVGHLDPQRLRFEKHRVWVIEGRLKPGQRHVYARRTFFIDEDSWQIALADHYDSRGSLWRVSLGYAMNFYSHQIPWGAMESIHDLLSGKYLVSGMTNMERAAIRFNQTGSKAEYEPGALRRWGR